MAFVNTRTAVSALGVSPSALRQWDKQGRIKTIRTPGGKRLYDISSIMQGRDKLIYARVSSYGQKEDLARQVSSLRERYPGHEVIEDLGSGLNFRRKGLKALLERVMSGTVEEVVIAHRDRLCRFGYDIIEAVASKYNTRIVVLDDSHLSPEEELVQDLLSIVHVFSCRLYGLRKYSRTIREDKDLPKARSKKKGETVLRAK